MLVNCIEFYTSWKLLLATTLEFKMKIRQMVHDMPITELSLFANCTISTSFSDTFVIRAAS